MTTVARVAFQGEPGAFSEEAVLAYFGSGGAPDAESHRLAVPTWRSVFEMVRDGSVDAGVVAIESSLAGSIRETYDPLSGVYHAGVPIVGEVSVPLRLPPVFLPGQAPGGVGRGYTPAPALPPAP